MEGLESIGVKSITFFFVATWTLDMPVMSKAVMMTICSPYLPPCIFPFRMNDNVNMQKLGSYYVWVEFCRFSFHKHNANNIYIQLPALASLYIHAYLHRLHHTYHCRYIACDELVACHFLSTASREPHGTWSRSRAMTMQTTFRPILLLYILHKSHFLAYPFTFLHFVSSPAEYPL